MCSGRLGNEAKETAEELGMAFARVRTAGADDAFVNGIAHLILERIANEEKKALSTLGPWPGTCAVGCCPNLRRELPVITEA